MALTQELRELTLGSARIHFHELTGTVIGEKIWSETHVTSSGGGGVVGRHGGYVSAPKIKAKLHTRRVIWLRDQQGNDHPLELVNFGLPVLEGHQVTAYWATKDGASAGPYVFVVNHSTGQREAIPAGYTALVTSRAGQLLGAAALVILLIGLLPLAFATGAAKWWLASGGLATGCAIQLRGVQKRLAALQSHLAQIATSGGQSQ